MRVAVPDVARVHGAGAVSGKKHITLRQRTNAEDALHEMWPSVPKSNVTKLLRPSRDLTFNMRTVSDFGGWCARWQSFKDQGAALADAGHIVMVRNGQTFTSPQYASMVLFGMAGMFMSRNHLWIDHHFINHTDHEVVTERLRWLIRSTEVPE